MNYKKCSNCGSHLDYGEICDCKREYIDEADKYVSIYIKNLRDWADANADKYPVLTGLKEEKIKDTSVLKMTAKYGRYEGLIVTFDRVLASMMRRTTNYAVAAVDGYETAQKWILEFAEWNKQYLKKNGSEVS